MRVSLHYHPVLGLPQGSLAPTAFSAGRRPSPCPRRYGSSNCATLLPGQVLQGGSQPQGNFLSSDKLPTSWKYKFATKQKYVLRSARAQCLQLPGLLTASPLAPLWQGRCPDGALARACATLDQQDISFSGKGLGHLCCEVENLLCLCLACYFAVALFAPVQLPWSVSSIHFWDQKQGNCLAKTTASNM